MSKEVKRYAHHAGSLVAVEGAVPAGIRAFVSTNDYDSLLADRAGLLEWAVDRWHAEVAGRPLVNVHRRSLDDTWRQIIRHLGGDTDLLCGPDHSALLTLQGEQP